MNRDKLLVGFLTATIGLLMLLTPEAFARFSVILLGGATVINGILIIFTTRNLIYDEVYNRVVLIRGLLSLVVGVLAVALPVAFAEEFLTAMAYTLGAHLVLSSLLLSFTAFKLRRNGIPAKTAAAEIAVSLGLAALLLTILALISPDRIGMTLVYVFGGILVLTGLIIVLIQWLNRPTNVIGVRPTQYVAHTPAVQKPAPAPAAKPGDNPKPSEPKAGEPKADAPEKNESNPGEAKANASEKSESNPSEAKSAAPENSESNPNESKPAAPENSESNPNESKSAAPENSESTGEAKPVVLGKSEPPSDEKSEPQSDEKSGQTDGEPNEPKENP